MPKKLYIKTHGCQMNEYDSEKMSRKLTVDKKLCLQAQSKIYNLIILNTCSIREKAQRGFPSNEQMENQREKTESKNRYWRMYLTSQEEKNY